MTEFVSILGFTVLAIRFPRTILVSPSADVALHLRLNSYMHRTVLCLSKGKRLSLPRRATPPWFSALAGESLLRHGHDVAKRTMSQYRYADVSLSDARTYSVPWR